MVAMECPFPSTTRDSGMKLMIVQLVMCNSTCKFWLVEFHSCFQMAVGKFSYKCVDMYIDTHTHTHTHTQTDRHTHTLHGKYQAKARQASLHFVNLLCSFVVHSFVHK